MSNPNNTYVYDYRPLIGGITFFLAISAYLIGDRILFLTILFLWITIICTIIIFAFNQFQIYLSITVNQDSISVKTWRLQHKILFHVNQVKTLIIRKSDGMVSCQFIITEDNKDKEYTLLVSNYRQKGLSKKQSTNRILGQFQDMICDNSRISTVIRDNKITTLEKDYITNTETGAAIRWFVWLGVLVFAVKLYMQIFVIKGIHFDTMQFLPQSIGIIVATTAICLLNLYIRKKKFEPLIAGVIGVILGMVLSSSAKTYYQWQNENNPQPTMAYYPLVLDLFDKEEGEQKWLVPKETKALIQRNSLYLNDSPAGHDINTDLLAGETYLIPIATGQFNDIFIVKNSFAMAKPKEE